MDGPAVQRVQRLSHRLQEGRDAAARARMSCVAVKPLAMATVKESIMSVARSHMSCAPSTRPFSALTTTLMNRAGARDQRATIRTHEGLPHFDLYARWLAVRLGKPHAGDLGRNVHARRNRSKAQRRFLPSQRVHDRQPLCRGHVCQHHSANGSPMA